MWISARTATTFAAAALLLVMVAVAAPLLPKPKLPSLPEERAAASAPKFGAATPVLATPERTRAQRMVANAPATKGAAQWEGRVGAGTARIPSADVVKRLVALLNDGHTVAAATPANDVRPAWVVRLVRDDHRVDVMVDPDHDRLVVARDGAPVGSYATAGLHREYAALGRALFQ